MFVCFGSCIGHGAHSLLPEGRQLLEGGAQQQQQQRGVEEEEPFVVKVLVMSSSNSPIYLALLCVMVGNVASYTGVCCCAFYVVLRRGLVLCYNCLACFCFGHGPYVYFLFPLHYSPFHSSAASRYTPPNRSTFLRSMISRDRCGFQSACSRWDLDHMGINFFLYFFELMQK